jgi:hypothetical protein
MRLLLSLALLPLLGTAAFAQAAVPKGEPPRIGLASAVEKDGKVIIEVFELRETMRMKMPKGADVFIEKRNWSWLATGTLGKEIRAYRPDGKPAAPKEVLNALVRPRGVTYFLGHDRAKPVQPDPFYLGLLREGSIGLAFDRPALTLPGEPEPARPGRLDASLNSRPPMRDARRRPHLCGCIHSHGSYL